MKVTDEEALEVLRRYHKLPTEDHWPRPWIDDMKRALETGLSDPPTLSIDKAMVERATEAYCQAVAGAYWTAISHREREKERNQHHHGISAALLAAYSGQGQPAPTSEPEDKKTSLSPLRELVLLMAEFFGAHVPMYRRDRFQELIIQVRNQEGDKP